VQRRLGKGRVQEEVYDGLQLSAETGWLECRSGRQGLKADAKRRRKVDLKCSRP
jgi:hypothetical protein